MELTRVFTTQITEILQMETEDEILPKETAAKRLEALIRLDAFFRVTDIDDVQVLQVQDFIMNKDGDGQ